MATLVVYSHYTSALVSLLTVTSTSVGFSSLQDLLHLGSYRLGFTEGTLLEQEFKVGCVHSNDDEGGERSAGVLRRIYSRHFTDASRKCGVAPAAEKSFCKPRYCHADLNLSLKQ